MREKVLIRVEVPLAGEACDFRVPYDIQCAAVVDIIAGMLQKMNRNSLPIHNPPVLWHARNRAKLDETRTLREQNVMDSDLVLII